MQTESAPDNDANDTIISFRQTVRTLVEERLAKWPRHLLDDVESAVLVGLWRRLPKYDPSRGVPLEAFIRLVCRRLITSEMRKLRCERPQMILLPDEVATHDDEIEDEQLAGMIQSRPEDYLSPGLLTVYRALQEHGTPAAAMKALKMKPRTFYTQSRRLKLRLKDLFLSQSDRPLRIAS